MGYAYVGELKAAVTQACREQNVAIDSTSIYESMIEHDLIKPVEYLADDKSSFVIVDIHKLLRCTFDDLSEIFVDKNNKPDTLVARVVLRVRNFLSELTTHRIQLSRTFGIVSFDESKIIDTDFDPDRLSRSEFRRIRGRLIFELGMYERLNTDLTKMIDSLSSVVDRTIIDYLENARNQVNDKISDLNTIRYILGKEIDRFNTDSEGDAS